MELNTDLNKWLWEKYGKSMAALFELKPEEKGHEFFFPRRTTHANVVIEIEDSYDRLYGVLRQNNYTCVYGLERMTLDDWKGFYHTFVEKMNVWYCVRDSLTRYSNYGVIINTIPFWDNVVDEYQQTALFQGWLQRDEDEDEDEEEEAFDELLAKTNEVAPQLSHMVEKDKTKLQEFQEAVYDNEGLTEFAKKTLMDMAMAVYRML
jgi:hypothetical protein